MRANVGGKIGPDDVIGRDDLIAHLWDVLERQSVVLTAERRLGKTSVITKMVAELPEGRDAVFQDLEKVHSTDEFARTVLEGASQFLSKTGKAKAALEKFLRRVRGVKIANVGEIPGGVACDWKELLSLIFNELARRERPVIFFWDELPMMLVNIRDRESERQAMEVLDVLRAFRQTHSNVRMVFTGSIGFHNAILALRRKGYANAPINDMCMEDVPPLLPEHAVDLAQRICAGEGIELLDGRETLVAIAKYSDRVPFYIHHIVRMLADGRHPASIEGVRSVVESLLTDPHDKWNMLHYRERIRPYYEEARERLALLILDSVAHEDAPLSFSNLFKRISGAMKADREAALDLLQRLQSDHYLIMDSDGRYGFRFDLVKRWWRLHRGLGS